MIEEEIDPSYASGFKENAGKDSSFVTGFVDSLPEDDITCVGEEFINLYVALKSKPMMILAGSPGTGKEVIAEKVGEALTDGDSVRFQKMLGRAWWAEGSGRVGTLTQLQSRFNTVKIFSLIEEACHQASLDEVFVALLIRISPAELEGYFSELAIQISGGEIQYLPSGSFPEPMPWPPNLLLIGTVDVPKYTWVDDPTLLSQTSVIYRLREGENDDRFRETSDPTIHNAKGFLRSSIRSVGMAAQKLRRLPGWRPAHLQPLLEIVGILIKNHVEPPTSLITKEVLVYLANAWSTDGGGLFSTSFERNLTIALDLAIAQSILPRIWESINTSQKLQGQLMEYLVGHFPRSYRLLEYGV